MGEKINYGKAFCEFLFTASLKRPIGYGKKQVQFVRKRRSISHTLPMASEKAADWYTLCKLRQLISFDMFLKYFHASVSKLSYYSGLNTD